MLQRRKPHLILKASTLVCMNGFKYKQRNAHLVNNARGSTLDYPSIYTSPLRISIVMKSFVHGTRHIYTSVL